MEANSPDDQADPTIILRVRSGDVASLADYMQEVRKPLLAYIERRLGAALRAKVEPDDILQEVGLEAVRSLERANLQERKPFSWLCHLAELKIVDAHRFHIGAKKRSAKKERSLDRAAGNDGQAKFADLLVRSMTTPSAAFFRNAKEARLLAAMSELPEDQREALRLRYVEDMPSKEIAERLGKSDAAIRVMLTRSIQKLQTLMVD